MREYGTEDASRFSDVKHSTYCAPNLLFNIALSFFLSTIIDLFAKEALNFLSELVKALAHLQEF